jgi:hypothetical protein
MVWSLGPLFLGAVLLGSTPAMAQNLQDSGLELPGVHGGRAAWGDYDGDGDADLILFGESQQADGTCLRIARVLRNDGGFLVEDAAQTGRLVGLYAGDGDWADYDNDGDLDLALAGWDAAGEESLRLYRSDDDTGSRLLTVDASQDDGFLEGVRYADLAWGDVDRDGDLDLVVSGMDASGSSITRLYANDGGSFRVDELNSDALLNVHNGDLAWADYDNDGDLDLALAGENVHAEGGIRRVTEFYLNESGALTLDAGLSSATPVNGGSLAWGDYDNDGNPDLAQSGRTESWNAVLQLYLNRPAGTLTADPGFALNAFLRVDGDLAWVDYDNDGDLDLAASGRTILSDRRAFVFENRDGAVSGVSAESSVEGLAGGSSLWGDYDGDGRADLLLTGTDGDGARRTVLYTNSVGTPNRAPEAPASLNAVTVTSRRVLFSWPAAADLEAPVLSYNLRIGSEPGAGDILSATTPLRPGNAGARTSYVLERPLAPDTYYWSVQAVDGGLARSDFASEGQFIVGQFVSSDQSLRGMTNAAMAWGDADDDGDVDLVLSGTNRSGEAQSLLYVNRNGTLGLDAGAGLTALTEGAVAWGDYDGDGDLDLFSSGRIAEGNRADFIYQTEVVGDDSLRLDPVLRLRPDLDASAAAWGDIDLDGDLDLVYGGQSADVEGGVQLSYTRVWANDGEGGFAATADAMEGLNNGDLALGDTDGDGDLDIVVSGVNSTGQRRTDLYRNDLAGGLVDAGAGLPGLESSDLALGDYDRDGDLDLAAAGITVDGDALTDIYDNDAGAFVATGTGLPGLRGGDLTWADYDNDQDLDLIVAGNDGSAARLEVWENTIGQAAPTAAFEVVDVPILAGVDFSAVAMVDPDDDGDLDLFSSGRNAAQAPSTVVNDNLTAQQANGNVAPGAPAGLAASDSADVVLFSWGAGDDDGAPPAESLTYQLRVGTSPGSHDVVSGVRPLGPGAVGHGLSQRISGLPSGTYFWSVQTVDAGYVGSPFAPERSFTVDTISPVVDSLIVSRTFLGIGQTVSLAFSLADEHSGIDPTVAPQVTARIGDVDLPVTALQFSGGTWTGELTITSGSPSGTATVSVRGAADLKGNVLAPFDSVAAFTVDAVRPRIVSVSPLSTTGDVAAGDTTRIRLTFDEALDPATVTDQNFIMRLGDAILTVEAEWDAENLQIVLTPTTALEPGSGYTVEAGASLADAAGNRVSDAISWTFRTLVPRLLTTQPAAGADTVDAGDGRIEATFDSPILQRLLATAGAVQVQREGVEVPLREEPFFDAEDLALRFEPAEGLRPGSRYVVTLSGLLGGPLKASSDSGAYSWSFATRVPEVTGLTPADGDTAVEVSLPGLIVTFDGAIDEPALDDDAVQLLAEGRPVPLESVLWDETSRQLTLTPAAGLRAGTSYRAQIAAAVRGDRAAEGASWTFGTLVPRVTATDPAQGEAIDAGPRRLRVTFSSAVDEERILPSNFRLFQAGRSVDLDAGEFLYDDEGYTVSLPEVDLVSGSEYSLSVLSRVGGPRARDGDVDVAFTTRVPAVQSTTPAAQAQGIGTGESNLQITFSGPIARRDGEGLSLRARRLDDVFADDDAPFSVVAVTGFGTDSTGTVVNFAPEGGLQAFTEYEVTVGADLFGDLADAEYSWRFSTAARLADATAGGTLSSADRTVEIYLPPNALAASGAEVRIRPLPALAGAGKPVGLAQGLAVGHAVELDAGDATLYKPATLTMRFDEDDLGGADPSRLGIFRLDGASWTRVGGTANPQTGSVSTSIESFATYALFEDLATPVGSVALSAMDCQPRAFAPAGGSLRSTTDISFDLSSPADVTVRVYNAAGRLERIVTRDQPMAPGRNTLPWDGLDEESEPVSSGLYVVVVSAGGAQAEKVVAVVR